MIDLSGLYLAFRDFVEPLRDRFGSLEAVESLFDRYGWSVTLDDQSYEKIRSRIAIVDASRRLVELADALREKLAQGGDITEAEVADLAAAAAALFTALRAIADTAPIADLEPFDRPELWQSLAEHLLDDLVDRYLRSHHKAVHAVLRLGGVIRYELVAPQAPFRREYKRPLLDWQRLIDFASNPIGALLDTYRWDEPNSFDHGALFDALHDALRTAGVSAKLIAPAIEADTEIVGAPRIDASLEALRIIFLQAGSLRDSKFYRLGLDVFPAIANGDTPTGLLFRPRFDGAVATTLGLGSTTLRWTIAANAGNAFAVSVFPSGAQITGGELVFGGRVELSRTSQEPWYLLGNALASHLALSGLGGAVEIRGTASDPEVSLGAHVDALTVRLDPPREGVLASLLGKEPWTFTTTAELTWSSKHGFAFSGSGGLGLRPGSPTAGPVAMSDCKITGALRDGGVGLVAQANGRLMLGPVAASVTNLGVEVLLRPVADGRRAGLLGDLALDASFKPPTGFGLALDLPIVKLGGFIEHAAGSDRYRGGLTVRIGPVEGSAYGVLDLGTQWSFLTAIATTFSGIPIGYGFQLEGLGGIVALNRRLEPERIRAGLRTGQIGRVLFPENAAQAATELLPVLEQWFPTSPGRHVVAPAAKITWGPGGQVVIKLAVALEVPDPIQVALAAAIDIALPRAQPIVRLQIDALGVIDFGRKTLALDASIHDSQVAGFVLSGDAALRIGWGDDPKFLIAIGGFHPRFQAPPGFPALRRVSLAVGNTSGLQLSGYFAMTSNTVQLGAAVSLRVEVGPGRIVGSLSFDAMIKTQPFGFDIEIRAHVGLEVGPFDICSITLHFWLSGPSPWRAAGEASIHILFFSIGFGFDVTFGQEPRPLPIEALPDPFDKVLSALRDISSRTVSTASGVVRVRLPAPTPETIVVQPDSQIIVKQTVVPLGWMIELYGGLPARPARFSIVCEAANIRVAPAYDHFAPAQYFKLSDAQKLCAPSFETSNAGVMLRASPATPTTTSIALDYEYETILWDGGESPDLDEATLAAFDTAIPNAPDATGMSLLDIDYVIATIDTMAIAPESTAITGGATTYAAVVSSLERWRVDHEQRASELQVLARFETYDPNTGVGLPRVIVTRQDKKGKNILFYDTVTQEHLSLVAFIKKIREEDPYKELYVVRKVHGSDTPFARPDQLLTNNLEPP